jgi:dihydrofolate reductase
MKRLRYQVAMSLDGFIACTDGSYDWIVGDPAIDFGALYREFDIAVMGRKTYDVMRAQGGDGGLDGLEVVVFSRRLAPSSNPGVRVLRDDPAGIVADLKKGSGRDIWLYGGGELCRTLLDAGLVDTVEVAVIPVVLGSGIPLVTPGAQTALVLADHRVLPKSGIVVLSYRITGSRAAAPVITFIRDQKRQKKRPARAAQQGAVRPVRAKR